MRRQYGESRPHNRSDRITHPPTGSRAGQSDLGSYMHGPNFQGRIPTEDHRNEVPLTRLSEMINRWLGGNLITSHKRIVVSRVYLLAQSCSLYGNLNVPV